MQMPLTTKLYGVVYFLALLFEVKAMYFKFFIYKLDKSPAI